MVLCSRFIALGDGYESFPRAAFILCRYGLAKKPLFHDMQIT
jgi:hypothetical protein